MYKNLIYIIFLISTLFLIIQHYIYFSWDYMVYAMNSRFFLGKETYFEWGRPPLTPFLMILGEYTFLIISSFILFLGVKKFSKKYKINPLIFYLLILSPYSLINGCLIGGTELLSLGILLLFFSYYDKSVSGFFMGLLCLNHYRNLTYSIFLFLKKKITKSIALFILTLLPWLIFNYFLKNDFLFSFTDQYALNVYFRQGINQPANILDIMISSSFLIPFAFLGIKKIKIKNFKKIDLFMILVYAISLISYFMTPFKFARYLYLSILPVAYFSAKFFESINSKISYTALIIFFLIGVFSLFFMQKSPTESLLNSLEGVNKSCMILSNDWVLLNYNGILSGPAPREELINYYLDKGYNLLLFKTYNDFEYVKNETFMKSLPIIYEKEYYYFISKNENCITPYHYNVPYLEEINNTFFILYNKTIELSLIDMIFKK